MEMVMDIIVFDLDGTLALNGHREHLIKEQGWDAYFLACGDDAPNEPVISVMNHLWERGIAVEVWSGRGAIAFNQTADWLAVNGARHTKLRMRAEGDYTPDDDLKESWLKEEVAAGNRVLMVFDDRDKVVAMWRRNGLTCFQVAPGNF
jgi:hypothetical protein